MAHIDTNTSKGKENLTRRAIIAGLAAAPIAAIPAIAKPAEPDAELTNLYDLWEKQATEANDLNLKLEKLEDAAYAEFPERHKALFVTQNGVMRPLSRKDIEYLAQNPLLGAKTGKKRKNLRLALLDEYETTLDEYETTCATIMQKHVGNTKKAMHKAYDVRDIIENMIVAAPAETVVGVSIKLNVWEYHHGCRKGSDGYSEVLDNAVQDAQRLGELS